MSYSTDPADELGDSPSVADTRTGLFEGDAGALDSDARRALVNLLQGPSVDGVRQTKLWAVILRAEAVLRSRLNELFLDLVIDREQKVAFVQQVEEEGLDAPILLRQMNLTFLESVLILFLRQRISTASSKGERAVVSRKELEEHLKVFERAGNVDIARFDRQISSSVEKAKKLGFLHKLRGTDERFEVSPAIKVSFSAVRIQAVTEAFRAVLRGEEMPEAVSLLCEEQAATPADASLLSEAATEASAAKFNDQELI